MRNARCSYGEGQGGEVTEKIFLLDPENEREARFQYVPINATHIDSGLLVLE